MTIRGRTRRRNAWGSRCPRGRRVRLRQPRRTRIWEPRAPPAAAGGHRPRDTPGEGQPMLTGVVPHPQILLQSVQGECQRAARGLPRAPHGGRQGPVGTHNRLGVPRGALVTTRTVAGRSHSYTARHSIHTRSAWPSRTTVSSVTGSPASRRARGQSRPGLRGRPRGRLPTTGGRQAAWRKSAAASRAFQWPRLNPNGGPNGVTRGWSIARRCH